MNNDIEFQKGAYGVKATIKTTWQDSFLKLLLDKETTELELNDGKGWQGDDLGFLALLPNLKALTILDFKIKSIEAIHYLTKLKKIEISTYCNTPVNFLSFPELTDRAFEWIEGSESQFEMSKLQKLFINNYTGRSSAVFSKLVNLEELSVLNSPIENLRGLSPLENLKILRLANLKNVTSLQGLEDLHKLEELGIQRCKKVSSILEIFELTKLKRLSLLDMGDIASIEGIEKIVGLRNFFFYESTNIVDGNLSPVLELKNLEGISFQNRKHYSHKREDFGKIYTI